jgi:hypothetical protein
MIVPLPVLEDLAAGVLNRPPRAPRPAHEVFGPQGEQVAALIERLQRLTPEEALAVAAAWDAAWDAARSAAWDAAGVLVRDVLDPEHYRTLTGPAASVLGPLHPDDDSGSGPTRQERPMTETPDPTTTHAGAAGRTEETSDD